MSEQSLTIPLNQAEAPQIPPPRKLLAPITLAPVSDYIESRVIRYAQYEYKTGTTFFLSQTQQIVADAYLETNNEVEACRVLNAIRRAHGSKKVSSIGAVKYWLKKPLIARYLGERFVDRGKVNWFNAAKWEAWGIDVMQGEIKPTAVQANIWKEYGKAKGWYKEGGPQVMNAMQINFVQSDGRL